MFCGGLLEGRGGALEAALDGLRHADIVAAFVDAGDRVAERIALAPGRRKPSPRAIGRHD